MMMRIIFGALLGLCVACPALASVLGAVVVAAVSFPPLLAAAVGFWAWPSLTRTVRGWTS
ncbi:hypothetical protein ACFVGX_36585 [Streptomyces sp. NPDC127113]|uniref:hypothetical protein n=1 Tax=Streptomyces sp. NPDC127113 TaxID=3345365 RepID=UPI0036288855